LSSSFEKFFTEATFRLSFSERSWAEPWRCSLCRSAIGFDFGLWSFSWLVWLWSWWSEESRNAYLVYMLQLKNKRCAHGCDLCIVLDWPASK
jgi:hypothetical protein